MTTAYSNTEPAMSKWYPIIRRGVEKTATDERNDAWTMAIAMAAVLAYEHALQEDDEAGDEGVMTAEIDEAQEFGQMYAEQVLAIEDQIHSIALGGGR